MNTLHKTLTIAATAALVASFGFSQTAVAQKNDSMHNQNRQSPTMHRSNQNKNMQNNHMHKNNNQHNKKVTHQAVKKTISNFKQANSSAMRKAMHQAYGYAVFPSVGKGGLVIGGAYGGGQVFKHDKLVGNATITKFDIGGQIGGETFAEIIFFKDAKTFNHFTQGNYQFSANLTAVGIKSGKAANNDYSHGVLVFTKAKGGLMAGASIGGQKFSYTPINNQSQSKY
jgi:lipid-binding SYLF domain-containing protein